ncbi:DYW domain containing protein [Parasponia andersonii]|uniref:DYW domain containing protein n=1 Tax=Parasponia andersonii TaxID=3476 RepID=A0A2P5DWL6_PARAD|nr:DYW domain containing protein [Parasponia andersonii]
MKVKQKLGDAIDLLYSRGCATSEAYTRLVLECVRSKDVAQAKRLHSHMELHLFHPTNTFLHNRLLHLYAKYGRLEDARNLFDKMPKRDVLSWNAMLSAFAKSGSVEDLGEAFDQMPERDSVSFDTMIAGLSRNGCPRNALEVFVRMRRQGFEPSEYTFASLLRASSQLLDLRLGKQIHGRVVAGHMSGNVFVWNGLTNLYAKCGDINRARWLFDRLVNKDIVSWNLMISGYLINGEPRKCIDLFSEMQVSGLKPDQVSSSNVVSAYFQTGCIDEAIETFYGIKEKDKICWTTMIVNCTQNGREEDAFMLFGNMLAENVIPDSFTISSVVSSCAKLASLFHGQAIHGKAILMGVDDDLLVSSALVHMYCKCGVTSDARLVFEMMPNRNVVSWTAVIGGYAQNGLDLQALALYEQMLEENTKPDNVTLVGVLSACIHANLVEKGQKYFDSISKKHGMTPTLDHYACMICLFGRSGNIDKALDLVKSMPHEPNSLIWSTLLSVCAMKNDIKNAEMAAEHLFKLDPFNAGPYIILSNMYATYGRWKDVASIRSLMKIKNVKKFSAYSWIEIDNMVHKFVSEDRSHPETEKIYGELNILVRKVQGAGFTPNSNFVLHDIGEKEKIESICYHSEKLALVFGLIKKPQEWIPIRIMKNIRICGDCHQFMKFVSKVTGRSIILRDLNRFHHFVGGTCSCKDYW